MLSPDQNFYQEPDGASYRAEPGDHRCRSVASGLSCAFFAPTYVCARGGQWATIPCVPSRRADGRHVVWIRDEAPQTEAGGPVKDPNPL